MDWLVRRCGAGRDVCMIMAALYLTKCWKRLRTVGHEVSSVWLIRKICCMTLAMALLLTSSLVSVELATHEEFVGEALVEVCFGAVTSTDEF